MARHGGERVMSGAASTPNGWTSPTSSPNSSLESRIPRLSPSPTPLKRSASLRGNHHRTAHQDLFPVINENGNTPKRSLSSLSLTPSKGRTRQRGHVGCSDDCSDADSVKSFGSTYSTASACDHASFALNGTTWSGRSRRYVVHCSSHTAENDEYLTPTQRAARQIRKFQALLKEARKEIDEKDQEIFRLTKEVVELRLYKASLNSPDEKTDSSETATVREFNPFSPESPSKDLLEEGVSPRTPEKKDSSLVDSGHFEDSVAAGVSTINESSGSSLPTPRDESPNLLSLVRESTCLDEDRKRIVDHYETRIEEMHRRHVDEVQIIKQNHNDKVESLLNQLSEMSKRYYETRPSLDIAEARTKELEAEVEALRTELAEQKSLLTDQEEQNKQMYLKMYSKGLEAARIDQDDQAAEQAQRNSSKLSIAELRQQLTVTQAELESVKPFQDSSYMPEPIVLAHRRQCLLSVQEAVSLWVLSTRKVLYRRIMESRNKTGALDPEFILQFLKSAIYYFLTDKENINVHLNAIESILGFTDSEKLQIDRIYRSTRK